MAYPTPHPARRLKIALKIKPSDVNDGVLLYCSETDEGHGDFISLAIRDRHLEFRFDAGNGKYYGFQFMIIWIINYYCTITLMKSLMFPFC